MSEVPVRFPARELKTHCDYVRAEDLVVGEVYFRVHFLDDQGLVPELLPREFVGRNLFPADEGGKSFLYFTAPWEAAAEEGSGSLKYRNDFPPSSAGNRFRPTNSRGRSSGPSPWASRKGTREQTA